MAWQKHLQRQAIPLINVPGKHIVVGSVPACAHLDLLAAVAPAQLVRVSRLIAVAAEVADAAGDNAHAVLMRVAVSHSLVEDLKLQKYKPFFIIFHGQFSFFKISWHLYCNF